MGFLKMECWSVILALELAFDIYRKEVLLLKYHQK